MAKTKLENTRQHAILINVDKETVTIPGAKENPEDRSQIINGVGEIDDSLLAKAKKNPVVSHYFKEGWLREK
jgi:hypothetical protein